MLILGVLLASIGIVLLVLAEYQRTQLRQLRAAERSTTKELAAYAESVSQALVEAGHYSQIAEVSGIVKCDRPLVSEVAKQPCVYYDARVWREYEESRFREGRRRRSQAKTRRGSEVVSSNSQRVPFWVEDVAGRIHVDPSGAKMEPVQIADRFEPATPTGAGGSLTIGSFSITLPGPRTAEEVGRRTIGYRLRERAIPLDRRVYVLGEVTDASGTLTIQKPEKGRFVISLRSKEEIVRSAVTRAQWITVAGAGSGATGLIVVALALLGVL